MEDEAFQILFCLLKYPVAALLMEKKNVILVLTFVQDSVTSQIDTKLLYLIPDFL